MAGRQPHTALVALIAIMFSCMPSACERDEAPEGPEAPVARATPTEQQNTEDTRREPRSQPADPDPTERTPLGEPAPSDPPTSDVMPGNTAKATCSPAWPALDLAPVRRTRIRRARTLNSAAIGKAREGNLAAALETLVEALETDPGHLLAWYNLAALHGRAGDECEALAALRQLARPKDCPWCRTRLVRARQDDDFAALHSDPRFLSLTDVEAVPQPSPEEAADAIGRVLLSQKFDALPPLIHPRDTIRVRWTIFPHSDSMHSSHEGRAAFEDWVESNQKTFHCSVQRDNRESCSPLNGLRRRGPLVECDDDGCCGFHEEDVGDVNHNTLYLSEMCFETDVAGAIQLSEVSLWDSG